VSDSVAKLRFLRTFAMNLSRPKPLPVGPGQESVWQFPRPAVAQPTPAHLRVEFNGATIASTKNGFRTLETSHPPSYYIPPGDIKMQHLRRVEKAGSFCEWKGQAIYYDVIVGDRVAPQAAWSYPSPSKPFSCIKDCVAFYPSLMDACFVDDERVIPQPGSFYGGWITSAVVGPFKGEPGSSWW